MQAGGTLRQAGELTIKTSRPQGPDLWWRVKNFPYWWRGAWKVFLARALKMSRHYGELRIIVHYANGTDIDYGVVTYRVVTNEFVAQLTTALAGTTTRFIDYDYHDVGTGTTAENVTDTALVTPYGGARATGTPSTPASNQYRSTATITPGGTFAITEHGLFDAASGTDELMDRSVFSAINVVAADSITAQYTLTSNAGG